MKTKRSACVSSAGLAMPGQGSRARPLSSLWVLAGMGLLGLAGPGLNWAQTAGVPLAGGTVPVLRGVVSGAAVINRSVPAADRNTVTINQSSPRAIIDWNSFNISSDSEVMFFHPDSNASTLNRIYDARPSVIQGRLSSAGPTVNGQATAGGQIILINQNGILFDRGSQVNTQSLVASTLNLSNQRYLSGALTSGGLTSAAFAGGYDQTGATIDGTPVGAIGIGTSGAAGAAAPRLTANAGGSIMLFAPRIDNQGGIITAPDGQVILAAGSKAYLALNDDESNTTLRGFRVEVEAPAGGPALNLSSLIRNAGEISADRGNVTLAALAVNQEGRVSAKTAVQNNGSIYLKANTADGQTGRITLTAGSVTEVQPDTADKATMPDSADYIGRRGVIELSASAIENRGILRAPGGRIALTAADAKDPAAARVYLAEGSETSVAGAWADVPYNNNLLTFRVTSNELKDSPDQKTGILRGAEVTVDLRRDNNILELSGYRDSQPRTVAEKAAKGGELSIVSGGSVVQRNGAMIDASGGGYRYGDGVANTTRLLGADGKIYDIATAPEALQYVAQLDNFKRQDPRWGQTQTFTNALGSVGTPEAGYLQGLGGGSVTIRAPSGVVLDGGLKGGVTIGPRQLTRAPRGASLTLGLYDAQSPIDQQPLVLGGINFVQQSRDTLGTTFGAATPLPPKQVAEFDLSAAAVFGTSTVTDGGLVETGFGTVELNSGSRITVPADVRIDAPAGTLLTLRAPTVELAGDVRLPGGQITMPPATGAPLVAGDIGAPQTRAIVRSGASISAAGVWINNAKPDGAFAGTVVPSGRLSVDGKTVTSTVAGGSISLTSQASLLERGAVLDVSGGGSVDANGRVSGGAGGSLTVATGRTTESTADWLQADLRGFGISTGGQLGITAPHILLAPDDAVGTLATNTTRLGPSLFSEHGFAGVRLNAPLGVEITANTALRPQQKNWLVDPLRAKILASGGALQSIAQLTTLPEARRGTTTLSITSSDPTSGAGVIHVDKSAAIITDPKARVALTASDGLQVDGRIQAPGGDISLTLNAPITGAPALTLGSTASLSTAGTFVQAPSDQGLVQGTVVGGGTVTLDARNAGVQLAAGSQIDVSGTRREVDVVGNAQNAAVARTAVDGPAGTLLIKSQGAVALQGNLMGRSSSATSAGGSFALELVAPETTPTRPDPRRVVVTQTSTSAGVQAGTVDALVAPQALAGGGFDKLRLLAEDRIELHGDATLNFARGIRLDAPLIELSGDARVELKASNVAIGQSLGPRVSFGPGGFGVDSLGASPVLATRAGGGTLTVNAGTVDLFGSNTVNGVKQVQLLADNDIRLIGRTVQDTLPDSTGQRQIRQIGSLTTVADVSLTAAQVYPATRSSFTVSVKDSNTNKLVADGAVKISQNTRSAGDVYSAGGSVSIEADNILQAGRLKAPLGELDLKAGKLLELAPGSVTSVSADGLTIPYGTTNAGVSWTYNDGGSPASDVSKVTAAGKTITLSGTKVDVKTGATVDLSGGGDVRAAEFVPGNGGSSDITLKDNTFAIIPNSKLSAKPVDTDITALKDVGFGFGTAKQDTALYDSLIIGAGSAVPAGDYVLLPARYALLPGAYLVQLQTGSAYANMQPGQTVNLANGNVVAAGFRAASGTAVRESQSVGVVVRPGSAARQESDYTLTGSQFFAEVADRDRTAAPALPRDAGRLAIQQASSLNLDGHFRTSADVSNTAAPGRLAQIDISGPKIAIVDQVGSTAVGSDYLQLAGPSISALAGSVLLGGTRADTQGGVRITTGASDLVVANSSQGEIRVPELILSAKDTIEVRAGAALSATGAASGNVPTTLFAEASGALLRLSNAGQTSVDRGTAPSASTGQITVAEAATLIADRAVLLDATKTTRSQGLIKAGSSGGAGGSISLASAQVSLGDVAGVTGIATGLVLSNADLAAYGSLDALTIKGYGGIDFFGSTQLGGSTLKQLTLDSGTMRGQSSASGGAASTLIQAQSVIFANPSKLATSDTVQGSGELRVRGQTITLGSGDRVLSGWSQVIASADREIVGDGTGSTTVAGDWTLQAQRVRGTAGANQAWVARDGANYKALSVEGANTAVGLTPDTALGARLSLEGQRVNVNTAVQALSGRITVAARATNPGDDVTLGSAARLNAAGAAKDFNGTMALADGGGVSLSAGLGQGQVSLAAGSVVDVSADAAGGNAGSLQLSAKQLNLGGELRGSAAAVARSGTAQLDLGGLAGANEFSALNSALNMGGFAESRTVRVRDGNIEVRATDTVAARDVTLAADAGNVQVAGTIGTGSNGRAAAIGLYAGKDVTLAAGSVVNADGRAAHANGGDLRIETRSGTLNFDAGATIDVRKGAGGSAGAVTFTLPRDDTDKLGPSRLQGTVLSQRQPNGAAVTVGVEARRSYEVTGTVSADDIARYAADHQAFMSGASSAAASVLGGLKGDEGRTASAVLRGATELRTAGDLSVAQPWDLTTDAWLQGGQAGTLSLRAAGKLTISNAVGSPNDNILAGASWNLRAVAGADLAAAQPTSTLSLDRVATGKGDLLFSGANAKLRTGTGNIELAAGRDLSMDNVRAVVYTAGRIGAADTDPTGKNRWGVGGGSITISAGRDVVGPTSSAGDLWITDWLRRPRISIAAFANLQPTDWWTYRPNFQQAVGTLGGGNISINAGRDVNNFSAMLPTTGRTFRDEAGQRQVDVQGGGDLRLLAGNDVVGGAYLVGRGNGLIDAAGDAGRSKPIQLYMMGASSGDVPQAASVDVAAGGALRVQSINNPTILAQYQVTGATGPSFGNSGLLSSFFTYSDNSIATLRADGGNLSLDAAIATPARTLGNNPIGYTQTGGLYAAFPASLKAVAFNGSVVNTAANPNPAVTYPSTKAHVQILANDSIPNLRLAGSDRDPSTVSTPTSVQSNTQRDLTTPLGGDALLATGPQLRITERQVDAPYVFDIQALNGSITSDIGASLYLPAVSRVRAGRDIVGASLALQNLQDDDVSVVRADQGDVRAPQGIEIRGSGRLVLQAGRNVDLGFARVRLGEAIPGGLLATGSNSNPNLPTADSARITVLAGVRGDVDLPKLDAVYKEVVALNSVSTLALDFYAQLATEPNADKVLTAKTVEDLARQDSAYQSFVSLDKSAPRLLATYQADLKAGQLPLGASADATAAKALYKLLNAEADVQKLVSAGSLTALATGSNGQGYQAYVDLDKRYPRLFADYVQRRSKGAQPTTITPIVFSDALAAVVAQAIKPESVSSGGISSFNTSIQTFGGSDIDLLAPGGSIVVGLTTPTAGSTIGVLTNSGGAIRSLVSGNFDINQGKVLTAQGGDILIFTSQGSIDAGRGAKTSVSTPPPTRTPVFQDVDGTRVVIGYLFTIPASASGSGIQTLTSDPDGTGPRSAPAAGNVYLFAPAGTIDAGEAGIRSSGNIVLNAQTVLNASNISSAGSSVGVPQVQAGSLASNLASSASPTTGASKAAEDAAKAASETARNAAAAAPTKPAILSVEVLGFGEKNCKENDKDCFGK